MNILRRAGVAGVCLLLGVSLQFVGGCGYKDHPVPPATVVPEAIDDLRYDTDAKGMTLTWSYPLETVRGKEIEDLASFELYRAEVSLKDYCGTCPIPFAEPLEQPGGVTTEDGKRRKAVYTMTDLRPGYKYFFKVRSRTSWFAESADSNIVSFVWQVPARAPEGLEAEVGSREIILSWQPVTSLQNGDPVDKPLQYQVLRSTGGKEFEKVAVIDRGTTYVDRQVAMNQQYAYQVQTLMKLGEETVGGGTSRPVSTVSVDRTAPAPPTGVTAIETDMGIKVFWEKSSEEDIGGYRVYRRAAEASEAVAIGDVQPAFTLFVDQKAEQGVRYFYSVTALDQNTPANESKKSAEATTRH